MPITITQYITYNSKFCWMDMLSLSLLFAAIFKRNHMFRHKAAFHHKTRFIYFITSCLFTHTHIHMLTTAHPIRLDDSNKKRSFFARQFLFCITEMFPFTIKILHMESSSQQLFSVIYLALLCILPRDEVLMIINKIIKWRKIPRKCRSLLLSWAWRGG